MYIFFINGNIINEIFNSRKEDTYMIIDDTLTVGIPKLYEQEGKDIESMVYLKLYSVTGWKWYITEFDKEDTFFAYVCGFENEWGYCSLTELNELCNKGLVLVDNSFKPCPLKDALEV